MQSIGLRFRNVGGTETAQTFPFCPLTEDRWVGEVIYLAELQ